MRIARGISITNTSKPISTAIAYDADATAFFTAASITDTTQKSAVNILVLSLKSANIWTKMKALYPVVGGVSSSHAVNLKQPGTFNLSFATGWTHSSTGMTPNGATYANTFLAPSYFLQTNSTHLSYYSRTNSNPILGFEIGCYDNYPSSSGSGRGLFAEIRDSYLINKSLLQINNTIGTPTFTDTNSLGFYLDSRTTTNLEKVYKNNTTVVTSTNAYNPNGVGVSMYIGAGNWRESNNTQTIYYGTRECAFASIGDGLTDAESLSFYNAVQTYQTTLGRQV